MLSLSISFEHSVSTADNIISAIKSEIAGPIGIPFVQPSFAYCISLSSFNPKNLS